MNNDINTNNRYVHNNINDNYNIICNYNDNYIFIHVYKYMYLYLSNNIICTPMAQTPVWLPSKIQLARPPINWRGYAHKINTRATSLLFHKTKALLP